MSDPGDDFRRLKESLGSLLLCWSRLEDALTDALGRIGERTVMPGSPFGERLAALRSHLSLARQRDGVAHLPPELRYLAERLDGVRRRRNLIAHRLSGVCADPVRGEPHIVCESRQGTRRSQVRISQTELTDLLSGIDRCTSDLGRVGRA